MNSFDFLLEIGVEDIPASYCENVLEQFEKLFREKLSYYNLAYQKLEAFATCRRLVLFVKNLLTKTPDREEIITGPAKKVAYDENNQPTIALEKFVEKNGLNFDELIEKETERGTYICFKKVSPGIPAADILRKIIPEVLSELKFPKTMIWNESRVPFIRPVTNILALLGDDLLEISYAGIESSNRISGHLLLSVDEIVVHNAAEYFQKLTQNFVLISPEERREKIIGELKELQEDTHFEVELDPELLNYYVYANEYPVVFFGEFPVEFLEIPSEIIITFLKKEKKILPVFNEEKQLMNLFVGVSNIPDELGYVKSGFEKVLSATLEDARFFWSNDLKENFYGLTNLLKQFMFGKDLGSYYDKVQRLMILADWVTEFQEYYYLKEHLKRAAQLSKNDLLTRMVREFPSLQGIVGGLYLKEKGESDLVWKAVYNHYQPAGFTSETLTSLEGGLLALCDKIDNIVALLTSGVRVTGSKDPYGLRRDANAIIKIIIDFKLDFDILDLIRLNLGEINPDPAAVKENITIIDHFFINRLENAFKEFFGFNADLIRAAFERLQGLNIYRLYLKIENIKKVLQQKESEVLILMHKRLKNILINKKIHKFSAQLLQQEEEKFLWESLNAVGRDLERVISARDYLAACDLVLELKPAVDSFFDRVMVMVEDEQIKNNRLALLSQLDELILNIADFSQIQSSGGN